MRKINSYNLVDSDNTSAVVESLLNLVLLVLTDFNNKGKKIAAICAAPSVFSGLGFLKGRKATSYPSFMEVLSKDGAVTSEDSVVVDGNITTSRGLGTAVDFALSLISQLENEEKAKEIAESVVYTR